MLLNVDQFANHLTNYERSAWRLETQPTYTMPGEQDNLARYLAGEDKPLGHNADWHDTVTALVSSGKTIGRVRTVQRPLTDYQRFQTAWAIPGNIDSGEDIRILDLSEHRLELPRQDFWLFDETTVVHLNFRDDGTLVNIEQIESPELEYYLKVRDTALAHAVPFNEWNARS